MTARQDLLDHLGTGATTVCRAWLVQRKDGVAFGFTDHDQDLAFDGQTFRAATGMTAKAVQQTTGLSVDNTEAIGALSDVSVTEDDLLSGRFDAAEVRSWLVNWADVDQRIEQFRGNFGEVIRAGGAFRVELRGFGAFSVRSRGARQGRNPRTGESIPIQARRVVTFHASHKLKEQIQGDPTKA